MSSDNDNFREVLSIRAVPGAFVFCGAASQGVWLVVM